VDESLRRAYLAAMEIPVWLPREVGESLPEPPSLPAPAREVRAPATPAERAPRPPTRPVLEAARPTRRPETPVRAARERPAEPERFVLGFASAGRTLFIEDLSEPRPARAACELLGGIAFVIDRTRVQPAVQEFAWPPPGVPFRAGEARDAVRGRIDRVASGGGGLARVVLLGAAPARVLLGWDDAAWVARAIGPARVEGLDVPVLCLPSLARMLREPAAKREAWQTLRLLPPGG